MPKINVVGSSTSYELEDVKDTVILLGGKYYFKHDTKNLVKVKTPSGIRLYRKESKLLVVTANNTTILKRNAILSEDGVYFDPEHPDTIMIDGKPTLKSWTIMANGKRYLKTDPRVVKSDATGKYYLKEMCVLLDENRYGKNAYYPSSDPDSIKQIDGKWYLSDDIINVMFYDKVTDTIQTSPVIRGLEKKRLRSRVFSGFRDPTNPQLNRYETGWAYHDDVVESKALGMYVLRDMASRVEEQIQTLIEEQNHKETEKIRAKLNANFGDLDETENQAKTINLNYQTWGGKQHLFGHMIDPVISPLIGKTGGIGYSFGVEIETSAGLLPKPIADKMGFEAVGDRSIGSAEYVTPVLHGDIGVDYLKEMANEISKHCLVDNKCSIHIHIGSAQSISDKPNCWPLRFDRRFGIAAIKLGTLLEEELFQILPKERHPYYRHCHSIRRYDGINENNYREYLGAFVFGPRENFNDILDMCHFTYGSRGHTRTSSLPTWCGSRYKWLNLVRAYSNCSAGRTIELRIWNATTNPEKIYNFLLLSLAFVYVADHHYKKVMDGNMTLAKMIDLAFVKYPKIQERLHNFVAERKKKFNRKIIYTGVKPHEIQSITSETKLPVFDPDPPVFDPEDTTTQDEFTLDALDDWN